MNVNKSHKKSPRRARALKPIERVPTKKLIDSIKRDIAKAVKDAETAEKAKEK